MTKENVLNNTQDMLVVKDLVKYFPVRGGVLRRIVNWVQAVDGVSFSIKEGETLRIDTRTGEFLSRA